MIELPIVIDAPEHHMRALVKDLNEAGFSMLSNRSLQQAVDAIVQHGNVCINENGIRKIQYNATDSFRARSTELQLPDDWPRVLEFLESLESEPTPPKIQGHEASFRSGACSIGCFQTTYENLRTLYNSAKNHRVTALRHQELDDPVELSEIEEILNYVEEVKNG